MGLFFTVFFVKLLETLPRAPVEAAMLDNARTWEIHAYITLPMLKAPLISLALVKAVESLQSFDLIFVMTGGGPPAPRPRRWMFMPIGLASTWAARSLTPRR